MVASMTPIEATASHSIKLLDLLTNRYHLGIIRDSSEAGMEVELPASSHFQAGQRVHFVVAGNERLVSRTEMRRGFITNVCAGLRNSLSIHLAMTPEAAVA